MQYTSAEAGKLLRKWHNQYRSLLLKEAQGREFVAAVSEKVEDCRPDYDYQKMQKELLALSARIRHLKHAINIFNSTTLVPDFDMTIDEMLVYIPQLTARQEKLSAMAGRPERERVDHYQSNIIDYRYVNYDLDEVKADADKVADELSRAQLALDKVNSTITFEVDV